MKPCLTQLHTEEYTIQREWTADGFPVLTASISVPQPVPATGNIARRIHRFYQLQARTYLRYCERWLLPQAKSAYQAALAVSAPLPCFHASLNYRITYNEGGFWSLYTQSREVAQSTSPFLTRHGDTWDLSTGYPVALHTFFPPRTHWKRRLLSIAAQEIQRQESANISIYHPHWRGALRRHFNARNFYLTNDGLAFFFPMYSIAPAIEQIPTFLIPYGDSGPVVSRQTA